MKNNKLVEYQYLWNDLSSGWVLLKAPDLVGGYCVFHKNNRVLLHIDNSIINEAVCMKMRDAGCEILENIPPDSEGANVSPI